MVEVDASYYKTQETIEAEVCEDDEDRKYKYKEELHREYSFSGYGWL